MLALALLTLVRADSGAYQATAYGIPFLQPEINHPAIAEKYWFEVLRADLGRTVPAGSTILIAEAPGVTWFSQRMAEFAAIHGIRVTVEPARADLVVGLGWADSGYVLVVEPAG